MTEQKAAPAAWEDPRVQQIYELLCDTPEPPTPDEHWEGWVARLIVGQVLEPAVAAERAWRDAVDEMLTVAHMAASDDPRESINRLINWHVAVALDPAVSSDAAALVAAERERLRVDLQDLAAMIGRLVTALRKARPMAPQDLDYKAIDLLRRKGLAPSPLREQEPTSPATALAQPAER